MTDKDSKIIKALEKIASYSGFTDDVRNALKSVLDLINRQKAEIDGLQRIVSLSIDTQNEFSDTITEQKSEIERLESRNNFLEIEYKNQGNLFWERVEGAKSEAIKEFAERLKANITINNTNDGYLDYAIDYNCLIEDIDDLVKEMVGEE